MERRRSSQPSPARAVAAPPAGLTDAVANPVVIGGSPSVPPATSVAPRTKRGVPEGLWQKCDGCNATIYRKEAEEMQNVCPQCGFHWYMSAAQRIAQLLDDGTFEEWDANLRPTDPLGFRDKKAYAERIVAEIETSARSWVRRDERAEPDEPKN